MSETQTEPPVEPVVPDTPAPALDSPANESAPDTPEEQEEKQSRGDRRFAELTARLSAAERREQERERELTFLRQQQQQIAPQDETPEQRYHRERAEIRADVEAQVRAESFHQQGARQFDDWQQRCASLIKMGADAGFAQMLVEMPEGVRVAAALVDSPAEVERIARLQTVQARAIALGKFAARVDAEDAPVRANGLAPSVQLTRAPAPVRPVTGRASPVFNEYSATGQQLVDKWMAEDLKNRLRR